MGSLSPKRKGFLAPDADRRAASASISVRTRCVRERRALKSEARAEVFWIAEKVSCGQVGQWRRVVMVAVAWRREGRVAGKEKVGRVWRVVRVR